jgi:uncharacterized protein
VKFWDASALVPLVVWEPRSDDCFELVQSDPEIAHWWGTPIEIHSGLERRFRQGSLSAANLANSRRSVEKLLQGGHEVDPTEQVKLSALHLLRLHPLKAADALQLAAALHLMSGRASQLEFVSLDDRLRAAALAEGTTVLP